MSHDDFASERYCVEQVMEILEQAARRLDARIHVPLTMLKDAVAFVDASEDPMCSRQHWATHQPLAAMKEAIAALEAGDASAAPRLARVAREYVARRRATRHEPSIEPIYSTVRRRLFDRLIEVAVILDFGASTAFPTARSRRATAT